MATYNLAPFENAVVEHADVTQLNLDQFDALFFDPARRELGGPTRERAARKFDPMAFSPTFDFVMAAAAKKPTGVKFGPGHPHEGIPDEAEAQWVSVNGDLVELSLWFGSLARPGIKRSALLIDAYGKHEITSASTERQDAPLGEIQEFVYEPDNSVIRSHLLGQLAEQLRLSGFVTDLCHDGNEAGFLGETEPYDAIILDLGLPGRDGLSVLKEWRSKGIDTPVLVLTARGQLHEKIEGLNAGADDYLTKPFQVAELVARVQALVRRAAGNASSILEIGGVRLDMAASQVWYEGTPIKLTAHEFRVLGYLMQHRGKVVSRSELIDHIYAQDFDRDSNTIEVFVGRLRKKLPQVFIETVRGLGYRLVPPP